MVAKQILGEYSCIIIISLLDTSKLPQGNLTGRWARTTMIIIIINFLPSPGKGVLAPMAPMARLGPAALRAVLLHVVQGPTNETPLFGGSLGGTRRGNQLRRGAGGGAGGGGRGRISRGLGHISLYRGRRSRGCILLHLGRAQTQSQGRLPLLLLLLQLSSEVSDLLFQRLDALLLLLVLLLLLLLLLLLVLLSMTVDRVPQNIEIYRP